MELKVSRTGYPGDLVVKLGSQEGGSDLGVIAASGTGSLCWFQISHIRLKLEHPMTRGS